MADAKYPIKCPLCGSTHFTKKGYNRDGSKRRLMCMDCRKHYSVGISYFNNYELEKNNKETEVTKVVDKDNDGPTKKVIVSVSGKIKRIIGKNVENINKSDTNNRYKYIYLHGNNINAFKRLADKLELEMELIDKETELYKITNPKN